MLFKGITASHGILNFSALICNHGVWLCKLSDYFDDKSTLKNFTTITSEWYCKSATELIYKCTSSHLLPLLHITSSLCIQSSNKKIFIGEVRWLLIWSNVKQIWVCSKDTLSTGKRLFSSNSHYFFAYDLTLQIASFIIIHYLLFC